LTRCQRNQSTITGISDADNSLSMRRGKFGSCASMNNTAGAGKV
jgi:hypothetical protein